jgi:hypothetical protein
VASVPPCLTVCRGGQAVSAWSAMVGHGTRRRQHSWRVSRGLAPLPALVPLPRWRGRVRSAGGAGALLAVLTPRPSRPLRCTRARALFRAEPPRDSLTACAALAEALLGRRPRAPPGTQHPFSAGSLAGHDPQAPGSLQLFWGDGQQPGAVSLQRSRTETAVHMAQSPESTP